MSWDESKASIAHAEFPRGHQHLMLFFDSKFFSPTDSQQHFKLTVSRRWMPCEAWPFLEDYPCYLLTRLGMDTKVNFPFTDCLAVLYAFLWLTRVVDDVEVK
jgi:hypothetical protein